MSSIAFPNEPNGSDILRRMLVVLSQLEQHVGSFSGAPDQQSSMAEKCFTPNQFAAKQGVGVSPMQCQEWCRQGRIDATRIEAKAGNKNRWRIPQSEYERYLAEGLHPRYSHEEFAEAIKESPAVVLRWCEEGKLTARLVQYRAGPRWRLGAEELRRFNRDGLLRETVSRTR